MKSSVNIQFTSTSVITDNLETITSGKVDKLKRIYENEI